MKLLLETTIQIDRVSDAPQIRAFILRELRQHELCSSSYVLREFLWTIINDIRYLHEYSPQIDNDGKVALAGIEYLLSRPPNNFSARSVSRMHLIIAEILAKYASENGASSLDLPTQKLLRYLE